MELGTVAAVNRDDRWTPFLRRISRPTLFTPELATRILNEVEHYGLTNQCAAEIHGVSASIMAKWLEEVPHFAQFISEARSAFVAEQIHRVVGFRRKDSQPDPYLAKWSAERVAPEAWGSPAAKRYAVQVQDIGNTSGSGHG